MPPITYSPSAPNVHTFSTQTTGTVMQVYFHDGSHLPFSPLMSLARLTNDSQHIPLAAICLSAFTANQTSEQPYSLMGGGLESAPACLSAPPHRVIPLSLFHYSFPSSLLHLQLKQLLCFLFVLSSGSLKLMLLLWVFISFSLVSPFSLHSSHFRSCRIRTATCLPVPARE